MKKLGFTLIELLVVVAILSLLSSIILSSLGGARRQARNTGRNGQIGEYAKALQLYKANNGSFPTGLLSSSASYCLGTYAGGSCGAGYQVNNPDGQLQGALQPYLPSFPPVGDAPVLGSNLNEASYASIGAVYECEDTAIPAYFCNPPERGQKVLVYWFLEGQNAVCAQPPGTTVTSQNLVSATLCRMILE